MHPKLYGERPLLLSVSFFLAISILVATNAAAGQIYMWEDKNGVTHITDTPPPKEEYLKHEEEYKRATDAELRESMLREQMAIERINRMIERDRKSAAYHRAERRLENELERQRHERAARLKMLEDQRKRRQSFEDFEDARRKQDETLKDVFDRMDRRSELYRKQRKERIQYYDRQ